MRAKKVVIVEDHQLFREGLRALLAGSTDFDIAGEAADGIEAVECIEKHRPDLVLLDLSIPKMSGFSVIKEIKSRLPDIRILALTIHESDKYVLDAFEVGADGYCLKDAGREELLTAVASVLEGRTYLSPGLSAAVTENLMPAVK